MTAAPVQIGQYVIDAELGRGAFGTVYRAHHVDRPDMRVALKIVEGRGQVDRLMLEPALPVRTFLGRNGLHFVGRGNTLQLLETALVIEGNQKTLGLYVVDLLFRQALSE